MKNKKLKLTELKVSSYVTNMNENEKQTVDGGMIAGTRALSIKLAEGQSIDLTMGNNLVTWAQDALFTVRATSVIGGMAVSALTVSYVTQEVCKTIVCTGPTCGEIIIEVE